MAGPSIEVSFNVDRGAVGRRELRSISAELLNVGRVGQTIEAQLRGTQSALARLTAGGSGLSGSLRDVEQASERVSRELRDGVTRDAIRARDALGRFTKGADDAEKALDGVGRRARETGSILGGVLGGTLLADAFEDLGRKAVGFGVDSVRAANDAADAMRLLETSSRLTNTSLSENLRVAERIRAEFGTSRKDAEALVARSLQFTAAAGRPADTERFLRSVGDLAAASGRKASELAEILQQLSGGGAEAALDKILQGKNPSQIFDERAAEFGAKSGKELDNAQQKLALLEEIEARGAQVLGTASQRLESAGGKIDLVTNRLEDFKGAIGGVIESNKGFEQVLDTLTNFAKTDLTPKGIQDLEKQVGPIIQGIAEIGVVSGAVLVDIGAGVKLVLDTVSFGIAGAPIAMQEAAAKIENSILHALIDPIQKAKAFLPQRVQDFLGLLDLDPTALLKRSDELTRRSSDAAQEFANSINPVLQADLDRFKTIHATAKLALEAAEKFGEFTRPLGGLGKAKFTDESGKTVDPNRTAPPPKPPDSPVKETEKAVAYIESLNKRLETITAKASLDPYAEPIAEYAQTVREAHEKLEKEGPGLIKQAEAIAASIRDVKIEHIRTDELEKAAKATRETTAELAKLSQQLATAQGFPELKIADTFLHARDEADRMAERAKKAAPEVADAFNRAADQILNGSVKLIGQTIDEQIKKLVEADARVRGIQLPGPPDATGLDRLFKATQGLDEQGRFQPLIDHTKALNDYTAFIRDNHITTEQLSFGQLEAYNEGLNQQRQFLEDQKGLTDKLRVATAPTGPQVPFSSQGAPAESTDKGTPLLASGSANDPLHVTIVGGVPSASSLDGAPGGARESVSGGVPSLSSAPALAAAEAAASAANSAAAAAKTVVDSAAKATAVVVQTGILGTLTFPGRPAPPSTAAAAQAAAPPKPAAETPENALKTSIDNLAKILQAADAKGPLGALLLLVKLLDPANKGSAAAILKDVQENGLPIDFEVLERTQNIEGRFALPGASA